MNNQQPKKDTATLEVKHEIRPDTYVVVEYEDGALKNVFFKIGYTTISIDPEELLNFYALTNWVKEELATRNPVTGERNK